MMRTNNRLYKGKKKTQGWFKPDQGGGMKKKEKTTRRAGAKGEEKKGGEQSGSALSEVVL